MSQRGGRMCGAALIATAVLASGCSKDAENIGKTDPQRRQRSQTMSEGGTNPVVVIETSMGTIRAELWAREAPITVENFLGYVDDRFFEARSSTA